MLPLYLGDSSGNPPSRPCILWIFAVANPGWVPRGYCRFLLSLLQPCFSSSCPFPGCVAAAGLVWWCGFSSHCEESDLDAWPYWPSSSRELFGGGWVSLVGFFNGYGLEAHEGLQIDALRRSWRTRLCPEEDMLLLWRGHINALNPSLAWRSNPSSFPCHHRTVNGWDQEKQGKCLGQLALMAHSASSHGVGETAAPSPLPAPKRRPRKVSLKHLRKSFQEPELFLLFDQSPDSFCMRGGGEPIRYTCHKLFLDH